MLQRKGIRWELTIVGQRAPIACVRATTIDDAERIGEQDMGQPMIAARAVSTPRSRGRFTKRVARVSP